MLSVVREEQVSAEVQLRSLFVICVGFSFTGAHGNEISRLFRAALGAQQPHTRPRKNLVAAVAAVVVVAVVAVVVVAAAAEVVVVVLVVVVVVVVAVAAGCLYNSLLTLT